MPQDAKWMNFNFSTNSFFFYLEYISTYIISQGLFAHLYWFNILPTLDTPSFVIISFMFCSPEEVLVFLIHSLSKAVCFPTFYHHLSFWMSYFHLHFLLGSSVSMSYDCYYTPKLHHFSKSCWYNWRII